MERVPWADEIVFPEGFAERYSALTDWEKFRNALLSFQRRSIRVNTLKTSVSKLKRGLEREWVLDQIPWCREGFWMERRGEQRFDIGNLDGHAKGLFYVQGAASMIPALVLEPEPGERVLDMCASPGGKTTQIAQYMGNQGEIVASEPKKERVKVLVESLNRMGVSNTTVVQSSGQRLRDAKFDRILVDAPCSGTGNMRRNPEIIRQWSPAVFRRISFEQKSLLHRGYCLLKKGGVLVYSTCSLEPEENEAVVDWLLKRHRKTEMEEIRLTGLRRGNAVAEFGGDSYSPEVGKCLRLWPQDNDTEGFFVAKIRKLEKRRKANKTGRTS